MAYTILSNIKPGGPQALLTLDITSADTQIYVDNLSNFESIVSGVPTLLVLKSGNNWERCRYTAKQAASGAGWLTVERTGTYHGSSDATGTALAFSANTKVYQAFTSWEYSAIKSNFTDHESSITSLEGRMDTIESSMSPIVAALIFG